MELGSGNTNMGSENQLRSSARAANILNPLQPLAQVLIYESGICDIFFLIAFCQISQISTVSSFTSSVEVDHTT